MKQDLKNWIKLCEGFRAYPYLDTQGKVTIGVGRNIDDIGISIQEADFMLENDIQRCKTELAIYPWYVNQPQKIKDALINMCFNMGITRLLSFKKMISALNDKNYTRAAREALESRWASQAGSRATDVALMIRQGLE